MPQKTTRKTARTKDAKERVLNRLSRLEGQLQGIRRMVEGEHQCINVITQIMAVRSAVSMLGLELLKEDLLCKAKDRKGIDENDLKALFQLQ